MHDDASFWCLISKEAVIPCEYIPGKVVAFIPYDSSSLLCWYYRSEATQLTKYFFHANILMKGKIC
jgi:hypothetical protein